MYSTNNTSKPAHRRVSRSYSKIPLQEIDNQQPAKKKSKKSKKTKLEVRYLSPTILIHLTNCSSTSALLLCTVQLDKYVKRSKYN